MIIKVVITHKFLRKDVHNNSAWVENCARMRSDTAWVDHKIVLINARLILFFTCIRHVKLFVDIFNCTHIRRQWHLSA
jgi:hypothetical protein